MVQNKFKKIEYGWGPKNQGAGASRPGGAPIDTPGEAEIEDTTVVPGNIPQHALNKSRHGHSMEEFKIGLVFSAWLHLEDSKAPDNKLNDPDPNNKGALLTKKRIGAPIFSKYRKFVVVARLRTHFVALPVYSHSGNGLRLKADTIDEYVSIRDAWDPAAATPGESRHGVLLSRLLESVDPQDRNMKWHSFVPNSVVWLTHPVCFRYNVHSMLNAQLEPASLGLLLELYWEGMRGMLWDAHDEVDRSLWRKGKEGIAGDKRRWEAEVAEKEEKTEDVVEKLDVLEKLTTGTGLGQSPAMRAIREQAARKKKEAEEAKNKAPGNGRKRAGQFSAAEEKAREAARKARKTKHSSDDVEMGGY